MIKINKMKLGITIKRLVTNIMLSSTMPPIKPEIRPTTNPIDVAINPAMRPISSETRVAVTSSVNTSRPKLSVPSGSTLTFGTWPTFTYADCGTLPTSCRVPDSGSFAAMTAPSVPSTPWIESFKRM